jgi:hypothetical protein
METECYCIYCKKHPLYEKRKELQVLTGWQVGYIILDAERYGGENVECLSPISDAFEELWIDPEDYEFPVTAYDDGMSSTGIDEDYFKVYAICENEEYEE